MEYKTSKEYDRLVELLDEGAHVLLILGTKPQFAVLNKNKEYYVGDSWLECDPETATFYCKDKGQFKELCEKHKVEWLDPQE